MSLAESTPSQATTRQLHQCTGCSHRRPPAPLHGWALARRTAWVALLAWLSVTLLLGLVGWAALIAVALG